MPLHVVSLKLYNTASPANAVSKSLTQGVEVENVALPPAFDAQAGDAVRFTLAAPGRDWNYAELTGTPFNESTPRTWYYFIDRLDCLGGTTGDANEGGYVAHLRLDPLMTYRSDIRSTNLYVARNELDYDTNIIDAALPQHYKQIRDMTPEAYSIDPVATPNNPCVVFETISQFNFYIFIMTIEKFKDFLDDFWGPNIPSLLSDPQSCVIRCFMLPYSRDDLSTIFPVGTSPAIFIGSKNYGYDGSQPYYWLDPTKLKPQIVRTITVSLPRDNVGWKSKDDHYRLYIPYCGILDLSGTEVYFDDSDEEKSIQIDYVLDPVTGDVTAIISPTDPASGDLHYLSGNMSIPIPFTSTNTTQRFISGISGLVSNAAAAASVLSNPTIGHAALLAGSGINTINSMRESATVNGVFGGLTSWGMPQTIYGYYWRNVYGNDDGSYARTYGRPLYQSRSGAALSGYTICENVHIQPPNCPANVAAEIKQLLESGVYFDDGL